MKHILFLLFSSLLLISCETADKPVPGFTPSKTVRLVPASFSDLPGWGQDDLAGFAGALSQSCGRIAKQDPKAAFGSIPEAGTYGDWQDICRDLDGAGDLKAFIEARFQPMAVNPGEEGLFTGYYEASLKGSRRKGGAYQTPLYGRPDDLVMVNLGEFREELKGQRIAGRVSGGNLKPYETRAQIVAGDWPHNDKALLWVDSPADAFFVQVQGSGLVELDSGETVRIGYAGQNGHPYYAIGRELIKRGELTKDNVSMQAIEDWLAAHPGQAEEIMSTNKSYVFFEKQKNQGSGPKGGEGLPLTPLRSLAVDRSLLPYGLPLFLDVEEPLGSGYGPIQRLMVAQDTGGAIIGAVRGDVFWGHGAKAEELAGPMKSSGRYWALVPRN
ncbi:MAG TPA: murein transglycosylase A [Alphaproteobacteria bacterium]|nr:murein transglycosylase A [Alphaproteobacteria bacterium]